VKRTSYLFALAAVAATAFAGCAGAGSVVPARAADTAALHQRALATNVGNPLPGEPGPIIPPGFGRPPAPTPAPAPVNTTPSPQCMDLYGSDFSTWHDCYAEMRWIGTTPPPIGLPSAPPS
jgi:hypothetical protein